MIPEVHTDEDGHVYVMWASRGPVFVFGADGVLTTRYQRPTHLEPLMTQDEAADWAADRISRVVLSKVARAIIADALGVNIDAVTA